MVTGKKIGVRDGKPIIEFTIKGGKKISGIEVCTSQISENEGVTLLFDPVSQANVRVDWQDVVETYTEPASIPPVKGEGAKKTVITEIVTEPIVTEA